MRKTTCFTSTSRKRRAFPTLWTGSGFRMSSLRKAQCPLNTARGLLIVVLGALRVLTERNVGVTVDYWDPSFRTS